MKDSISFNATVERVSSDGGWHIVRLPVGIVNALRVLAEKEGSVPILATIGRTTWPTTMKGMGEQRWFFAVSASVRKAEKIDEWSSVSVSIAPDNARVKKKV